MKLKFIATPTYTKSTQDYGGDEWVRKVENELLADPKKGEVMPRSGGFRKLRIGTSAGKRGGARVIYLYVETQATIHLLLTYPKNKKTNLSESELKTLRGIAKKLKEA